MKFLTLLFLAFCTLLSAQNPYAALNCDSVVIFDYQDMMTEDSNIEKDGNSYRFKKMPLKAQTLTRAETDELIAKVYVKSSFGAHHGICYSPHMAAMFMKNGNAIAYLEFCTSCNRMFPSIELDAQKQEPQDVGNGEVYYLGQGLSSNFRKYLSTVLLKYGFSHLPTTNHSDD